MESLATYVRRCYSLLSPDDRSRWFRLTPIILLTSAIEAVGTVSIFLLVASLTEPESLQRVPVIGQLLGRFANHDRERFGVALILMVGLFYIAKSIIFAIAEYVQAAASARTASNLSIRLLTGYLRAPYLFHAARNSSDMVHKTTYVAGATFGNVISAMLHIVTELLVFAAILGVLFLAAPWMTLAAAGGLILVGGVLMVVMRRSSARLGEMVHRLSSQSMRQQTQALSALDEIKVLGRTEYFAERFAELSHREARVAAKSRFFGALPRILVETLFISGALAATVTLMVSGASTGRTVSLLGLFAYAGFRIIPSANRILMHVHTVRHGQAGIERIRRDLDEIEAVSPVREGGAADWDFTDQVRFSGVAFTYPDQAEPAVADVDLVIRCGESLAIVGPTGSGKSSLIRMLVGLLQPSRGTITIDGCPIGSVLGRWRGRLGFIPQEVRLVEDSLRRNVAFGLPDAEIDDEAVAKALRRAQLDEFAASLPEGWNSTVGDRGVRLSGGERQRVGIARALYRRPHVVILDEATSSLDPQTEARVLSALRSELEEGTLIAVTHRIASVRGFDRIVYVDGGRIRAVGTFEELERGVAEFRRLGLLDPSA